MVLTAYSALSLVTGLSCHHRLADHPARLDASVGASGPHDFAVRHGAARLASPRRPSHPAPNVRDDREAPLLGDGTGGKMLVIWGRDQREPAAADWHDGQIRCAAKPEHGTQAVKSCPHERSDVREPLQMRRPRISLRSSGLHSLLRAARAALLRLRRQAREHNCWLPAMMEAKVRRAGWSLTVPKAMRSIVRRRRLRASSP
jgi:hypothetical protein